MFHTNKMIDNAKTEVQKILFSKFPPLVEPPTQKELNTVATNRESEIEKGNHMLDSMTSDYVKKFRRIIKPIKIQERHSKNNSINIKGNRRNIIPLLYTEGRRKRIKKLIQENSNENETKPTENSYFPSTIDTGRIHKKTRTVLSPLQQYPTAPTRISGITSRYVINTSMNSPKKNKSPKPSIVSGNLNGNVISASEINSKFFSTMQQISSMEELSQTTYNALRRKVRYDNNVNRRIKKKKLNVSHSNEDFLNDIFESKIKKRKNKRGISFNDDLKVKKILSQYNQISKISPEEIYKLRYQLCGQLGLRYFENKKKDEMSFERMYKKNMKYVTPNWVTEAKEKQKKDFNTIINIRQKTKLQLRQIYENHK